MKDIKCRRNRHINSNFRSGSLPLEIERCSKPKVNLTDRLCTFCDTGAIESEEHFLISCDFYSDIRYSLFLSATAINEHFNILDSNEKLIFLMNNREIQNLLTKSLTDMFYENYLSLEYFK